MRGCPGLVILSLNAVYRILHPLFRREVWTGKELYVV